MERKPDCPPHHVLAPSEQGWALLVGRSHRTLSPGCHVPDLPTMLGVFTSSRPMSPCLPHCSSSRPRSSKRGLSLSLIPSTHKSHSQRLLLVTPCSSLYAFQQHLQWASITRQVLLQVFGRNVSTRQKFLPSPNSQVSRAGRQ